MSHGKRRHLILCAMAVRVEPGRVLVGMMQVLDIRSTAHGRRWLGPLLPGADVNHDAVFVGP